MATAENNMPFIKNLASSDRKLRDSAVKTLRTFLSSRAASSALTFVDALKLWKGLFYALWMCDKPVPQQNLCASLAGLLDVLPSGQPSSAAAAAVMDETLRDGAEAEAEGVAAAALWLRAFWATMAREWTSIDVLRMEKFLLLVRRTLGASLAWTRQQNQGQGRGGRRWNRRRVDALLALLEEWPLSVGDDGARRERVATAAGLLPEDGGPFRQDSLVPYTVPAGLRIHVCDIWVDEAERASLLAAPRRGEADGEGMEVEEEPKEEDDNEVVEILRRINALVEALARESPTTAVKRRAEQALEDERLPWNRPGANVIEDDGSWDGFD